jgi:hypothetical protein
MTDQARPDNGVRDPINRSTYAFCHGERRAVRISWISIAVAVFAQALNA